MESASRPSSSASSSLSVLIARLKKAGIDWDGENVADLLWLVSYIDAPVPRDDYAENAEDAAPDSVRVEIDDSEPAPLPEVSPELTLTVDQPQSTQPESTPHSVNPLGGRIHADRPWSGFSAYVRPLLAADRRPLALLQMVISWITA